MKKALLIVALAITGLANAQKGSILVAGSVGIEGSKSSLGFNEDKTTTFNFSPKIGYQATDHWTFGVDLSVAASKEDHTAFNGSTLVTETTTTKTTMFSAGPFARYTMPVSELFSLYADMGAGFQSGKQTTETPAPPVGTLTTTQKGDGFYLGITPAVFINVKKNFGLNVSIGGLRYETMNIDGGSDNNHFIFNFGQTVNIGISKNF